MKRMIAVDIAKLVWPNPANTKANKVVNHTSLIAKFFITFSIKGTSGLYKF